jgi:hypothetical protein
MPWTREDYLVICLRCGEWEQADVEMSLFTVRKVTHKQRSKRSDQYFLRYRYRCNRCGYHQVEVRHNTFDPWPVARRKRLLTYADCAKAHKPLFNERKVT